MTTAFEFLIRDIETGVLWCLSQEGEYLIGSDSSCEIRLQDPEVSSEHARLTIKNEALWIEELQGAQGTYLDDSKILEPTKVRSSQKIRVGKSILEVEEAHAEDFVITYLKEAIKPNNYKIGTKIAQGGMGVVYEAFDLNLERNVAMKVLSSKIETSRASILRFVQESRVTGRLEHPNIIPLYEMGINKQGAAFYTMKLVHGITLKEILDKIAAKDADAISRFSLPRLLTIFEKVCDAVAFAHSKGIIHRDLKPQNVMVGEYGEVLLLDWGLAKHIDEEDNTELQSRKMIGSDISGSDSTQTVEGLVLGTPDFMAPEQVTRESHIDVRTDIFALGGILYNILCLRAPYGTSSTLDEKIDNIKLVKIPHPTSFNSPAKLKKRKLFLQKDSNRTESTTIVLSHCSNGKVPNALSAVAMKAMAIKPEERYQSAQEIQKDVQAYQSGFMTSAEEAGMFKSLILLIKRHRKEAFLIGTGLFIIILLTAIFIKEQFESEREKEKALQGMLEAEKHQHVLESKEAAEARREWIPIFQDDFSDPNVDKRWDILGSWKVENGELHVWGEGAHILRLKTSTVEDVRLEFDCHQEGDYLSDISCFVGSSERNWDIKNTTRMRDVNAYLFQFGGFLNTINRLAFAGEPLLIKPSTPIIRSKLYHVCVEKNGTLFKCAVNHDVVLEHQLKSHSTDFTSNRFSLGLYGWKADTYYDNVRVYSLNLPLKGDLLDIAQDFLSHGHYPTAKDLFEKVYSSTSDPLRLEKAQHGIDLATQQIQLKSELSSYREKILTIWPKAAVALGDGGLTVDIHGLNVTDLSPLKDMPINDLDCSWNLIANLEPLRGMPLNSLNCSANQIATLAPLEGMSLKNLKCSDNKLTNLEPLRGTPLSGLWCNCNQISSLSPLEKMSLSHLECTENQISSLNPLKGIPLHFLVCSYNQIQSLEPLRNMPLKNLSCENNQIGSLEPLKGMSLNSVSFSHNQITNLEPLRGMPLVNIRFNGNKVTSLMPLAGMKLNVLQCLGNPLTELGPLFESPETISLFSVDQLSSQRIQELTALYSKDPKYSTQLRSLKVSCALKDHDFVALKKLATNFEGHSYLFVLDTLTWGEAKAFCEKTGGHLCTITTERESNFVLGLVPVSSSCWIGLDLREQDDHWITGEKLTYRNFFQNSFPSVVKLLEEKWYCERDDQQKHFFVIEWD
jgi:serine/threonine protein kinase